MSYKKEGDWIVEYRTIPETEEMVRRYTAAEFDARITVLQAAVAKDPKTIGDAYIASKQKELTAMQAAKTALGV